MEEAKLIKLIYQIFINYKIALIDFIIDIKQNKLILAEPTEYRVKGFIIKYNKINLR